MLEELHHLLSMEVSMHKLLVVQALAVLLVLSGTMYAQDLQDIEKTWADILANKKKVIAATLQLSEREAAVFWPLYEEYQNALRPVYEGLPHLWPPAVADRGRPGRAVVAGAGVDHAGGDVLDELGGFL